MNRFLLSSLLAASAALGLAADISFETRATTLDKALDALSKQNNIQIKAVGPVARQVVVIKVDKQPLEAFLKHLCSTLAATATQKDGVIEIAESATAVKQEDQEEQARTAKALAKNLAEQTKDVNAPPMTEEEFHKRLTELKRVLDQIQTNPDDPNNALYDKATQLQEAMPTSLLVRRLMATISPAELAAIPAERRIVYATNPTRMQRAFNGNAQRVLTQYASEFQRVASALSRFPKEQQDEFIGVIGGFQGKGVPAKVLLGCTKYAGENISIELQVLDGRGRVIATGSTSLAGSRFAEDADNGTKAEAPAKDEKPLKVGEESKVYFALMSRGVEGAKGGIEVVQEPLRSKVLNPEEHDPLSYGVTDLLLGAAEDRKLPMIVVVPDSAQTVDVSGTPKAGDLFTLLRNSDQIVIDQVEGWLVGKPAFPGVARRQRINRAAYGALIRSIAKNERLTLGDLVTFAIAQRVNPGYDSFHVMNLYSLFGSAIAGYDLSAWEAIRFYGFLGESNRRNMSGKTVVFGSLPKDAQDEITVLVYKQPGLGFATMAPIPVDVDDSMFMPCMDPTEILPNGIPSDSKVTLSTTVEAVVMPTSGFAYPMGASELAASVAMQERPDLFPWTQENRVGDKFRMSTRHYYDFSFEFGPNANQAIQLWDFSGTMKEVVSLGFFPSEFKQLYDQALKEMREAYKNMKPQDLRGRGGPPPPPPL